MLLLCNARGAWGVGAPAALVREVRSCTETDALVDEACAAIRFEDMFV